MALPDLINRLFSFTAFQQGQGDNTFPGTNIDADLDQTNNAVNGLRAGLATLLRPDGKLANGIVGRGALAADILLGVGPSKPWSASQSYRANVDTVTRANKVYLAVVASVGVDPLTDLTGAYWTQTADLSQAVVVADGSIGTNAFAAKGVTEPKLADGAASNRVYAAKSITRDKADDFLGLVPVGTVLDYSGVVVPTAWLLCYGQAVSRTSYPALLAALTVTVTATLTASSTAVTSLSRSISSLGLRGAAVEGPGVPNGTILIGDADGSVSISNAATASGANVTLRIFPYGRGDGSSTFTLPDARGRVAAGRDDMGGVAAGRLVTVFDGANLASFGGSPVQTLLKTNLPTDMPGGSVSVGYPAHQYETRNELTTVSAGAGGTAVGGIWKDLAGKATVQPAAQQWGFGIANAGGSQPFVVVQPTFVTNKIIFAGA